MSTQMAVFFTLHPSFYVQTVQSTLLSHCRVSQLLQERNEYYELYVMLVCCGSICVIPQMKHEVCHGFYYSCSQARSQTNMNAGAPPMRKEGHNFPSLSPPRPPAH